MKNSCLTQKKCVLYSSEHSTADSKFNFKLSFSANRSSQIVFQIDQGRKPKVCFLTAVCNGLCTVHMRKDKMK